MESFTMFTSSVIVDHIISYYFPQQHFAKWLGMTCNCIWSTEITFEIKKQKDNIVYAQKCFYVYPILGDPGAVSRVGRKGGTKVFRYGQKSPWVPTLTELCPKIQPHAGSWLGTKNALYCAQSAKSFSWVLFVSSYTTATVRFVHQACACKETFIFYFPNQKRRNYRWVEKTFGMLSAGAIQFAPRIFCFWRITSLRCGGDEKVK